MLQNFKAYQLARSLYQECAGLKTRAPMRDQLQRASLSIVLNLAEGQPKQAVRTVNAFMRLL